jgi:hypothetical protein
LRGEGRDFNDYDKPKNSCDRILVNHDDITIISGGANGADKLRELYGKENNLPVEIYPAEWDKYGKSVGYKINQNMSNNADGLIAFWNGKSKGTKHMIDITTKDGLKVIVIRY